MSYKFYGKKSSVDFLSLARFLTPLSIALSFAALVCVALKGFSYGVDFAGGNEIQARFLKNTNADQIREVLKTAGISNPLVQSIDSGSKDQESFSENTSFFSKQEKEVALENSNDSSKEQGSVASESAEENTSDTLSNMSKEFLIRVEVMESEQENNKKLKSIRESLEKSFQKISILRVDSVGPQIGKELRQKGILAIFYSLLMILIYLGLRFDSRYAPAAVFCLFHDAIITLSIFSLFRLEVSVQTLAAILAIIGYSLNDTIVTFDRIRENQALLSEKKSFFHICNQSLNDVLSRTLLTSFTTLLAVGAMWFFADDVIKDFAFTLAVGVVIGTYSSLFVATPLLFSMDRLFFFKKRSFLEKKT